jgi:hypothetical protein
MAKIRLGPHAESISGNLYTGIFRKPQRAGSGAVYYERIRSPRRGQETFSNAFADCGRIWRALPSQIKLTWPELNETWFNRYLGFCKTNRALLLQGADPVLVGPLITTPPAKTLLATPLGPPSYKIRWSISPVSPQRYGWIIIWSTTVRTISIIGDVRPFYNYFDWYNPTGYEIHVGYFIQRLPPAGPVQCTPSKAYYPPI